MSLAKVLREERANIWEQGKALLDYAASEKRDLSAEEDTQWRALNSDLDRIDKRVKELEEGEQRTRDMEAAFDNIERRPSTDPADEQRRQSADAEIRSYFQGKAGKAAEFGPGRPMGTEEYRTLSKLTAGAGANTVKVSFYERLMAHLIEVSGVMSAGPTVLTTDSGEQIQIPKTTSHSSAALVAEAGTISASDPAFGQVPLDAYKYGTLVQVSTELITDTSVDLLGYVAMQAGRALGNAFGAHAITGNGSSQPNGIVTAATLGVTGSASVSGAFSYDNLVDLFYSVIEPYRRSASCGWLLRDASLATVRKIKDSQNRPLWEPSMQAGVPDTILGKPVHTDPNVAAVALSAKSLLFGDFSQYFVRMVGGLRFERSDDYAFNTDLVTFRALLRADGDLVDTTGAVKYFIGNAA